MDKNVIYNIILLINSDNFYGVSEEIEICKGKYKMNRTIKDKLRRLKRKFLFFIKNI